MRSNNKRMRAFALMLAMAGGSALHAQPKKSDTAMPGRMVADTPVQIGEPYTIAGISYTPTDPAYYDEVGYAVLLDGGSRGDATANGEAFVSAAIAAAHKSLPLPSYVEVTALDSGRTILVRVNDRGPMRNDRLIALSPGAVAQLGVGGEGAIPVRVRRVNPPEQERAALRAHGRAAERLETPAALLKVLRGKLPPVGSTAMTALPKAKPAIVPASPSSLTKPGADFDKPAVGAAPKPAVPKSAMPIRKGGYVVQVGAFSSQARAETLAKNIGAHTEQGGTLWRVRFGPYPTQQAAQAGVRAARTKGFENARIIANDAR
ncbi:SPOR domain-containing protein [Sphingobium sp. BYY-5]|uniref:RlpA-like double-psi beta-barrel domain-containing protein n=1 Tax=Sphingobium sp. BYY-5 TaxID=2926400 RepID=UPI001FA81794|nr:RlpA-like double-psi beta-barrel domain-containing protein [Sphingobium sp. BYY-5]MCI4589398.1 SPOR domain-containing protein [Sphingobium sp. BYY-5]